MQSARREPKFVRMQNMKAKSARGARRSREEWTAEVVRWRRSGLSSAEYAAEHGLNRGRLMWWSWQLGAAAVDRAASRRCTAPAAFVPLRVREENLATEMVAPGGCIEVILGNGRRIRVVGAVDAAGLARVITAVEGGR